MAEKTLKLKDIEKLLGKQTTVILSAVDEKLLKTDARITALDRKLSITEINILAEVDKKLLRMEVRINQKFDKLTTTIDKFLVRLAKMEDEFEVMKLDINRLKKVIREKLGVDLL